MSVLETFRDTPIHSDVPGSGPARPLSCLLTPSSTVDELRLANAVAAVRARHDLLRADDALRVQLRAGVVAVTASPAAVDAPSMLLLANEIAARYHATVTEPDPQPQHYADVQAWLGEIGLDPEAEQARREIGAMAAAEPAGAAEAAALLAGGSRSGGAVRRSLDLDALHRLDAERAKAVLLAAWQAVLHRCTGLAALTMWVQHDLRALEELAGTVGPLSPRLPFAIDLTDEPAIGVLAERTAEVLREQSEVVELVVDLSRAAGAFGFTFTEVEVGDWAVSQLSAGAGRFELDLSVSRSDGRYELELWTPPGAGADPELASVLLDAVAEVATQMLTAPEIAVSDAVLGDGAGRGGIRPAVTECAVPQPTLQHGFAAAVAQHADRPALTWQGVHWTYRELDQRAERLAEVLHAAGIRRGDLVPLFLERGPAQIVAMLAVVRLGAAYVPVDVRHPGERVEFVLADCAARLVVTSATHATRADLANLPNTLVLDEQGAAAQTAPARPELERSAQDLAYLIYTSGSTGRPKAVAVQDHQVLRLFPATGALHPYRADQTWVMYHSYAFDFSVLEMWAALLHGGRLVLLPDEVATSPSDFLDLLAAESVTVLSQTPGAFRGLVTADGGRDEPAKLALQHVILGGEALELEILRPWLERRGAQLPTVTNIYGPTEAVVHVNHCVVGQSDVDSGLVVAPIDGPITDMAYYVLDERMRPVPAGVIGELYLGGGGVSCGYFGRPELTAEKFLPDRFAGRPGARMYRTGDLVRVRADGRVEYRGRADAQVKVRGFRVELGEIESVLTGHDSVQAAVADVRDGQLVGYLVAPDGLPPVEELRAFCAEHLASYLVPAVFSRIDEVPLTVNGKVNRRALPDPDLERVEAAQSYVAPRDSIEAVLAEVWAEVLNLEQVGAYDNFFTLGGDSLRAMQIVARLRELTGVSVSLQQFVTAQTVAEQAPVLLSHDTDGRVREFADAFASEEEDSAQYSADVTDGDDERAADVATKEFA